MHITVRAAEPRDAAPIAAIYNQAVVGSTATFDTERQTAEARSVWLEGRPAHHPVLVAELDGAVVGWASFSAWSPRPAYDATVEISIYVDGAHRGLGIGPRLGRELIERAPALGIRTILSRVCTENEASIRMGERLGFTPVGVMHQVGRKFGRWLDVLVAELVLAETDAAP